MGLFNSTYSQSSQERIFRKYLTDKTQMATTLEDEYNDDEPAKTFDHDGNKYTGKVISEIIGDSWGQLRKKGQNTQGHKSHCDSAVCNWHIPVKAMPI